MATLKPSADLSFFDGETLLRIVATALVRLSQKRVPPDPVYDDAVQSAFNHLVLRCLRRNVAPPGSVPEMASWAANRPVREWPLGLPGELDAADGYLVDEETRMPTQQCFEWAVSAPDAAAEVFENHLMSEALTACRAANSPESYTAFRRLLTVQPVLTGTDLALLNSDLDLSPLTEVIKRSYSPAPASYLRGGVYALCERCKCLLVPVGRVRYRCELDRCRRENHPRVGRTLDPTLDGGVYQLTRPLRMFITGPGLAEVELERAAANLGLEPQMWPNFDAYDLRIPLPGGRAWAVDVKDRANPALLGRGARPLRPDPPYDRGFLVVPDYRFDERDGYGQIFEHHRSDEVKGRIVLLSEREFLDLLESELSRPGRRNARLGRHGGREDA